MANHEHALSDDLIAGAKQAAQFTGLSVRAIYHMVETGHLPVIRMGRAMYFRKSEMEQAFRSGAAVGAARDAANDNGNAK